MTSAPGKAPVKKLISIICPVHNEEGSLPIFYSRLSKAVSPLRTRFDFELIFTNNASTDGTLDIIRELRSKDPIVQVITLSKNFGYQQSLLAGLHGAKGDAIIIIDSDCEDPPELIPTFVENWEKGFDIVYGRRDKRPEPAFLQLLRKGFYRVTRAVADYDFILDMAEFSLFTSRVKSLVLSNRSTFPFIRAEIGFVGFKRMAIPYVREPRAAGKTHYNFSRMAQFAVGGVLSSSTFPLRLAVYLGLPLLLINVIAMGFWIAGCFKDATLLFMLDFLYAILVLMTLSTYLARTYKDGVQRPLFIVDWDNTYMNPGSMLKGPDSPGQV